MSSLNRIILFITALLTMASPATHADDLNYNLPQVSLLTVGPGEETFQLEGHTALRLLYPSGEDLTVNWGVFDFNTPNFAYRFCKGETDYSIGLLPMRYFVAGYAEENRSLTEQVLDLTPAEIRSLENLIRVNLRPENMLYRYNYVKDNCATRPLDLIEKSLAADSCRLVAEMPTVKTSFRDEMRHYHRYHPTYQLFIDYILGSGIDYQITPKEQAFAPIFLEQLIANSLIEMPDGSVRKLVKSTDTILQGPSEPSKENLPNPWIYAIAVTALALVLTWRDQRRRKVTRWFDCVFYLILGVLGLILTFMIFVSTHEATSPNVNYLWINPLCLIAAILIWFRPCKKIVFCYQIINFALLTAFIVGLPFFNQSTNIMFIPIIISDMLRSANYLLINRK